MRPQPFVSLQYLGWFASRYVFCTLLMTVKLFDREPVIGLEKQDLLSQPQITIIPGILI